MDNKILLQIRTRFWCHSVLESLGLKNVDELTKLLNLNTTDFRTKFINYFPDKIAVDKAHAVLCSEAFDSSTWRGYFNGSKNPTTRIRGELNAYEFIGTALPQTQLMYENGPYNFIKILTSSYIKDAVIAFSNGVSELYSDSNKEITVYELNVDTNEQEVSSTFQKWWDKAILRGSFNYCHTEYSKILTDSRVQLSEGKCILELINSYIKLNFFGNRPDEFCRILIQGTAVNYIKDKYDIETNLWSKAIPIFSDTLIHFSDNKDQMHWIKEEDTKFLTD